MIIILSRGKTQFFHMFNQFSQNHMLEYELFYYLIIYLWKFNVILLVWIFDFILIPYSLYYFSIVFQGCNAFQLYSYICFGYSENFVVPNKF